MLIISIIRKQINLLKLIQAFVNIEDFKAALRIDPDYTLAKNNLEQALRSAGREGENDKIVFWRRIK